MRIVDRATFLAMPAGTLFAKYTPCVFDDLRIKGDSLDNGPGASGDFTYQQITDAVEAFDSGEFFSLLDNSQATDASVPMDFECEMRDGLFDENQLFAVFERADVEALISRLQAALSNGYPQCDPDRSPKGQDGEAGLIEDESR